MKWPLWKKSGLQAGIELQEAWIDSPARADWGGPLRRFATAWQFLTCIPLSRRLGSTPQDLAGSMAFYPLVGFLIGGGLWLSWIVLSRFLPLPLADFFLIVILVLLTGGIHLDGFADAVDGFGGGKNREEILAIMRDKQIGAFGVAGLVLLLLGKYLALSHLPAALKGPVLAALPAFGRWAMVLVASCSPYARPGPGLARPFLAHLGRRELFWASLTLLGVSWWLLGIGALVCFIGMGIVCGFLVWYFRKKIGGVTGDCLGAAGELVELLFLTTMLGILYWKAGGHG